MTRGRIIVPQYGLNKEESMNLEQIQKSNDDIYLSIPAGSSEPISILLVDDDVELCSLLRHYFELEGFQMQILHQGSEGVSAALSGHYAMAILDVMMPGMNGIEVLRRIRLESSLPILMLTAMGDDADRIRGLELGADDYVPKPCTPRELVARVRAILRRVRPEVPTVRSDSCLEAGALRLWPGKRLVHLDGEMLALTSTQFRFLELMIQNTGRVVTRVDLSELGLGRPLSRFDRSVDVHVSCLRTKLGELPDGRSRIQTVRGQGYILLGS